MTDTTTLPLSEMSDIEVALTIGVPIETWHGQCHAISLAIVKAGLVPGGRVARGSCRGVGGQHSWIVNGRNCYDPQADIIDPTLWTYVPSVRSIWRGGPRTHKHTPHGAGSIFAWGMPVSGGGEIVELEGLSKHAQFFVDMIGPLDARGWNMLFSGAPVEGWPAGEILEAASKNRDLAGLIPIDRLGMLTDVNPQGLYF